VGYYVVTYPVLGTSDTVPDVIVAEEYRIRQERRDSPQLSDYQTGFPQQWLQRGIALAEVCQGRDAKTELFVDTNNAAFDRPAENVPGHQTSPQVQDRQNFGAYEILDEAARGGMRVVYRARHHQLNRIVALKMIKTGELTSDDEVRRFQSEAEASANLHHPNIVAVYDVGGQDGQHYFAMSFVEGRSLS